MRFPRESNFWTSFRLFAWRGYGPGEAGEAGEWHFYVTKSEMGMRTTTAKVSRSPALSRGEAGIRLGDDHGEAGKKEFLMIDE